MKKKTQKSNTNSAAAKFLARLNRDYAKLHTAYESAFWETKMGRRDESVMNAAMQKRDDFRSDTKLLDQVRDFLKDSKAKATDKKRLALWERFFTMYITPDELKSLRKEIADLESDIFKIRTTRQEGYIDPNTGNFMEASENKMRGMIATESDWRLRKACFEAMEKLPDTTLPQYVELIKLRNKYARALGRENFYDYKIRLDEGITTEELRKIFDPIYEQTRYAFDNIKTLADKRKKELGDKYNEDQHSLLKPWNFAYMMVGDITKEEDQYFPFNQAIRRWQVSMINLGVDFAGGKLTLDLLDRKGKYNNGFCHWPKLVQYPNAAGESNFTCNVVPGQIGSAHQGYHTLFHEGGHAAHLLNSKQSEVCVNHEYPPSSVSLAETQSMFMDTIFSSIDWSSKYAKNIKGGIYPFALFEKSLRQLHVLRPLRLMSIIMVVDYELSLYSLPDAEITPDKIKSLARGAVLKYTANSQESLRLLNIPHIYSWESSAYYHGYGLAELAVYQLREFFYKKYDYIVDNPKIGKDLAKVWALAGTITTNEMVKILTGKTLSPLPFIESATSSIEEILEIAQKRIAKTAKAKQKVKIDAQITKAQLDRILKAKIKVV